MIVVISDLHLTDGSSGETINAGAFLHFVRWLRLRAHDACWRADGTFSPIDRCDLVLDGDIFDVIRSDLWLQSDATGHPVRPWSRPDLMAGAVATITRGIIARNREALAHLSDLRGSLTIEGPDGGEPVDIPLHIHYLVGNHDWFYRLPGDAWSAIRRDVVAALGLANDPERPFPHDLNEASTDLHERCMRHRAQIRHGDMYDEFNYEAQQGRNASSLGDCIVVELLNRFPFEVQSRLGLDDADPTLRLLKEIDNVRPLLHIPSWLDGVLRQVRDTDLRLSVLEIWDERTEEFLELDFVRARDRPWSFDTVDALQIALGISSAMPLQTLARLGGDSKVAAMIAGERSYVGHAMAEPAIRSGAADFVVYGHTHHPETISMDSTVRNGGIREQVYFNSGTWRRVHEQCVRDVGARRFTHFHVMTMIGFYVDGERAGRSYETWSGRLG